VVGHGRPKQILYGVHGYPIKYGPGLSFLTISFWLKKSILDAVNLVGNQKLIENELRSLGWGVPDRTHTLTGVATVRQTIFENNITDQ
jgi:hypothetical protein